MTFFEDIFSHSSREKKISEDNEITPVSIRRALEELFARKPTRMHILGLPRAKAKVCQSVIISRNEKSNRRMRNSRSPCKGDCFRYLERSKINQHVWQLGHPKTQTMQTADRADCADCADRADRADWVLFFLSLFLHSLLTRIFFRSGHKLVFNYISECLFVKRPFYVTLAWYVIVDVL